ncbi:Platinum sensitivity protein, partial [Lunasporangiospora selenospora]
MDPLLRMRVKVYRLTNGTDWIDQGTGHCSCEINADKSEGALLVHSEEDEDRIILNSRIKTSEGEGEDPYQRQQETLIVWTEDDGVDLALSFQEAEGCAEIWESIAEVQQRYNQVLFDDSPDINGIGNGEFTLPDPDINNLAEIEQLIKEAHGTIHDKERLAAFVILHNYVDKLVPMFETCEDLESMAELHILHRIMIGIITLNDIPILQYILKDEVFFNCLGMLEYEPELDDKKEDYREFLTKRAKFKQVVPISDRDVEQKIHHAFRLHFLRDTVLARVLDDGLSTALTTLIFYHNMDIVTYIHQDRVFLKELFDILENEGETTERKRDVVLFVQQFCSIAKGLQQSARISLYRTLTQTGLFKVLEFALADSQSDIRTAGAEIMLLTIEHDPNVVRSHIVKQVGAKAPNQLMDIILDLFLKEVDMGIKLQFSEVIRLLLDTNSNQNEVGMPTVLDPIPNMDPEADKFLDILYSPPVFLNKFVSPLLELEEGVSAFSRPMATTCENICQILSFMVRHHAFRSKYYVLSSGIVPKVCLLFKNRDQHLRLSALRFFRTCIGLNDEFYHRYLIKNNLIQHIVELLLATGNKNNLLNSACIEFFEFIRSENIKSLITHVVPAHGEKLRCIEYVTTFKSLIRRYEQLQDSSRADSETDDAVTSTGDSRSLTQKGVYGWMSSTVDEVEEAYFNDSEEEDEVPDDEGKEDDPPMSDWRRRTKPVVSVEHDDDSLSDEEEESADHLGMDDTTRIISGTPRAPSPPPPILPLRRKLVDYGEDDDDSDEDSVFTRHVSDTTKKAAGPTKTLTSDPDQPPEKRPKLGSESENSNSSGDESMQPSVHNDQESDASGSSGLGLAADPTPMDVMAEGRSSSDSGCESGSESEGNHSSGVSQDHHVSPTSSQASQDEKKALTTNTSTTTTPIKFKL